MCCDSPFSEIDKADVCMLSLAWIQADLEGGSRIFNQSKPAPLQTCSWSVSVLSYRNGVEVVTCASAIDCVVREGLLNLVHCTGAFWSFHCHHRDDRPLLFDFSFYVLFLLLECLCPGLQINYCRSRLCFEREYFVNINLKRIRIFLGYQNHQKW